MTSTPPSHPEPSSTTGSAPPDLERPDGVVGEFAVFDPALHAAAVAERGPRVPVMAAGWWSSVTCPEDPRALELRHIPGLPAADAARITALFAEVVEAGGGCVGDAWGVLTLWELGSSGARRRRPRPGRRGRR